MDAKFPRPPATGAPVSAKVMRPEPPQVAAAVERHPESTDAPNTAPAVCRLQRTILAARCCDRLCGHSAARERIAKSVSGSSLTAYYLDLGNSSSTGQFVLGEPLNARNKRSRTRLRTVAELFDEIVRPDLDDDNEPSCSAVEAIERHPFLNAVLAQHALALLARL